MTQSQPVWPKDRPSYDSLAAAVQGEASRFNIPGIAVGILNDGEIDIATAGFGNLAARQPVTDHTIFQIGSISKVFTATLAQLLVQEGVLDLDTPVKTYLPDLELADAETTATVTTRHLLSHTSGIEGDRFLDYGLGDDALAKSVTEYHTLQQWYTPGELFAYSNTSLSLAGRVIEVLAGTSFEQAMQEKLLNRLRMPDTVLFTHDAIVRDAALGYLMRDRAVGNELATPYAFSRQITPAGNIVSSVSDLLRFARFHMNDGETILRGDLARQMRVPTPFLDGTNGPFGIGWAVSPIAGTTMISHNGATNGQQALLQVFPERGFAIAMLSNSSVGLQALGSLSEWALERYRGITIPKPAAIELPQATLKKWTGIWERHDRRVEIELVDGALAATVINSDPLEISLSGERESFPLEPLAENKFRVTKGDYQGVVLEFLQLRPDAKGNDRDLVRLGGRLAERKIS